jgi:hypothetical protein
VVVVHRDLREMTCIAVFLQVLCVANTGRQFLLHELLLCWHKELASSSPPAAATTTAAAAAATTPADDLGAGTDAATTAAVTAAAAATASDSKRHAKLIAFLLLMQHLAGFYKTEQLRFKQGLAATLQASAVAAAGADTGADIATAAGGAAAAATAAGSRAARKRACGGQQRSQQRDDDATLPYDQQAAAAAAELEVAADAADPQSNLGGVTFDYMLGEEERQWVEESTAKFTSGLLEETAPACYLPMLRQLLSGAEVPAHVKVGFE